MSQVKPVQPNNYPADYVETVVLKDETRVVIRPIRPDDAPRLQEGFRHLSPETIYYRFLEATNEITDEQARQLTTLDYQKEMALVGTILEGDTEHIIGVARYALIGSDDPGVAETAVVVRDDYQGRGLGSLLYVHLIDYARQHGVLRFDAIVHQSNARIMKFIRRSGLDVEREMLEPGIMLVKIYLNSNSP